MSVFCDRAKDRRLYNRLARGILSKFIRRRWRCRVDRREATDHGGYKPRNQRWIDFLRSTALGGLDRRSVETASGTRFDIRSRLGGHLHGDDPVLSKNTNELKTGAPVRFDRHRLVASPSSGACRRRCRRFGFLVRAGKTPFSNEVPRSRVETWIQALGRTWTRTC